MENKNTAMELMLPFGKTAQGSSSVHMRIRVVHVRYFNESNGFSILIVRKDASTKDITIKGSFEDPCEGAVYDIDGEWVEDKKYGKQIDVKFARPTMPDKADGIRKFLSGGVVKNIGESLADRIVDKFGDKTIEVMDSNINMLLTVEGIGKKKLKSISESWKSFKGNRESVIYLLSLGVSLGYAAKICKKYGKDTIGMVKSNPYILIDDVDGIGFAKADAIALNMGFDVKGDKRLRAGLVYTLTQASYDGDCYMERKDLVASASEVLKVDKELVAKSLNGLISDDAVKDNDGAIYLPTYLYDEASVAKKLVSLLSASAKEATLDDSFWKSGDITYDDIQKDAICKAMVFKVMVLTGGPGTGKTTTINGIIKAWKSVGMKVLLAAPTGRAAKRMNEATGYEAKTIHRLLEYNPDAGFQRNESNPIEGDALVVDEASMIDIELMFRLVSAIPANMRLLLVGDIDQLPSVGAGNVLRDIIASKVMPTVRLTRIFRQAATSRIITNAHLVNEGKMPEKDNGEKSDFFMMNDDDYLRIENTIVGLVTRRLPEYYEVSTDDIQVLSPMRRTNNGIQNLNHRLQQAINPIGDSITYGDTVFRIGDKVMQLKNNYEQGIFNGDTGKIVDVDEAHRAFTVSFDGGPTVEITSKMMKDICLSYATTIHKSQGSEYKVVVIPMTMQFFTMLQRNLLYTGITRAKKVCVLIGQKKAIAMAVRNNAVKKRNTLLKERLISESKKTEK